MVAARMVVAFGACALLAVVFGANSPAYAQTMGITVSPMSGKAGTVATIRGHDYDPTYYAPCGVPIYLSRNYGNGSYQRNNESDVTGCPDANGSFTVQMTIPSTAIPGLNEIQVVDGSGGGQQADFTVLESPQPPSAPALNPTPAPPPTSPPTSSGAPVRAPAPIPIPVPIPVQPPLDVTPPPAQNSDPSGSRPSEPMCPLSMDGTMATVTVNAVPVLFVHGILSDPSMWSMPAKGTGTPADSLVTLTSAVGGVATYEFDYSHAALLWVNAAPIGPSLAVTINCLAHRSKRKVVVVAHSLGGLATQFALHEPSEYGGSTATNVASVVTLGTPFDGSKLLTYAQLAKTGGDLASILDGHPEAGLAMDYALSWCASQGQEALAGGGEPVCQLASALDSPIGQSLQFRSGDIRALQKNQPWPPKVQLHAEAGDVLLGHKAVFRIWPVYEVNGPPIDAYGDLAVSTDSAEAVSSPSEPVQCDPTPVFYWHDSACFHNNLQGNPPIVGVVLSTIRSAAAAQVPAA